MNEDLNKNSDIFKEYSILHKISDTFKVPIYYNDKKMDLKKHIINDLELIENIDPSCSPIYSYCFNNDNDISTKITTQIAKYYTTDILFLKDSQQLLREYISPENKYTDYSKNYKNIIDIWNELKAETGFKDKYCYIDWDSIEFLNHSEIFLQILSIYSLFSPVLSLLLPIFIIIIPFFIIKISGLELTIDEYVGVLKSVAQNNAIGKLLTTDFQNINSQEGTYILVSAAFYIFSIYQNIMTCIKFYNNMKQIHSHFHEIKLYLKSTINSMENYLKYSSELNTHEPFNNIVQSKLNVLNEINEKLESITEYSLFNISKFAQIGTVLKYFYELHTNNLYEQAITYSIGFNGYIDCIEGLQKNICEERINYALFIKNDNDKTKNTNKSIFKNSYYACLNAQPIKNTIKFNKNKIITGPNASGKTTILKSTLINIILTQQFGCGFYDSAKLTPFNHIHCYLNIPDTSGRDSLFQAEARRCKEILDTISVSKDETHFFIFDELYSVTNPEEAETRAKAFIMYLQKYKNVSSMLTTHFINICKKLNTTKGIQNCQMITEKNGNLIKYKYKLKKGISNIKGGITILTDMNYPKELIDNAIIR